MIVSSRRNFHDLSLRRTPTRASFDRDGLPTPYLRIPLLDSPLPSPGLPSIIPRHGKKSSPRWMKRMRKLLWWTSVLASVAWLSVLLVTLARSWSVGMQHGDAIKLNHNTHVDGKDTEIVVDDDDVPGPILIKDERGRVRWTVSLPPRLEYPLAPAVYARICGQAEEIQRTKTGSYRSKDYYAVDKSYTEVSNYDQPESPNEAISATVVGGEKYVRVGGSMPPCKKSLIFVMQTEDAAMGTTLMHLWTSYGLAKKEGRAFFIDDRNWAYGKYTTYFKQPPSPGCVPPPSPQRTPYPHHAQHLLVSSATAPWTFGRQFQAAFEGKHSKGVDAQKNVFNLIRPGYEALFHLAGEDGEYVEYRLDELRNTMAKEGGALVAIHVRHGDRRPLQFQYQNSYIPLTDYIDAAHDLMSSLRSKKGPTAVLSKAQFEAASTIIVASDDPDVYTDPEMKGVGISQAYISLVSKSALDAEYTGSDPGASDLHIGWEGGFFSSIFWSLGASSPLMTSPNSPPPSQGASSVFPPHRIFREPEFDNLRFRPPPSVLQLRELVGRAYLLDLAIIGHGDGVVCALSSVSCRLAGVMLGWERGVINGAWRNVDGAWGWKGFIW